MADMNELLRAFNGANEDHAAAGGNQDGTQELFFVSVQEVLEAAKRAYIKSDGKKLREIADWVVNHEGLTGRREQWHSVVNVYFNEGDYYDSQRIAQTARKVWPYDLTLLADIVQSCRNTGDWEVGFDCIEKAREVSVGQWDWYLLVQTCEYYVSYAKSKLGDEREKEIRKAIAVAEKYIQQHPNDERAYNQQAELFLEIGDETSARNVLEEAIFKPRDGIEEKACQLNAAQCCITYIDNIIGQRTDYDMILKITHAGILFSAQETASTRMGYFLYREALALDGKLCEAQGYGSGSGRDNVEQGFGNEAFVRKVLNAYVVAYGQNQDIDSYAQIIRQRFEIIKGKANAVLDKPITDIDLGQETSNKV